MSAARSTLVASPGRLLANGASTTTVVATALDATGAAVAGTDAVFAVTGSGNALSASHATTGADGQASVTLASTYAETKDVSVVIDGVAIQAHASVEFDAPGPFRLLVTRTGGGKVDAQGADLGCGNLCSAVVARGTSVTLTAAPDAHSAFLGWSGACSGQDACTVTVEADTAVGATFSACPGAQASVAQLGGAGEDRATAVALDASGNAIVAGTFTGTASFGGAPFTSRGARDVFVTKRSAAGAELWSVQLGGRNRDEATAVAVAPNGDAIVAGRFEGTATFGTAALTSRGAFDAFAARLAAADGHVLWARNLGGTYQDEAEAVATDAGGDVYLAGAFHGTGTFGTLTLVSSDAENDAGYTDAFVAKLAGSDGAAIWAQAGGGPAYDEARAVAVDPGSGDVVVAGMFEWDASFGTFHFPGAGSGGHEQDVFVARYAGATGAIRSAIALGGSGPDDDAAVVVDANGDAWVGWTSGFMGLFQGRSNLEVSNPIVSRVARDGSVRWTRALGTASWKVLRGLALDDAGEVVVVGGFGLDAEFGGPSHRNAGTSGSVTDFDAWWAVLSSSGDLVWSERFGGPGLDEALGVASRGSRTVAAGRFSAWVDTCDGVVQSAGDGDAFLADLRTTPEAPSGAGALVTPVPPPQPPTPRTSLCVAPTGFPDHPPVAGAPSYVAIQVPGTHLGYANNAAVGVFGASGADDALVLDFQTQGDQTLSLWRNDGTGHLTPEALDPATSLHVDSALELLTLDADRDGHTDVFIAQCGYDSYPWPGALNLLLAGRDDTLVDETLERLPGVPFPDYAAAVADVDCDGAPDVLITQALLVNDGAGHFRDETAARMPPGLNTTGAAMCDVDRDGAPDIVMGDTGGQDPNRLLHNDGLGNFSISPGAVPAKRYPHGQVQAFACGDFDRDGWNDLAVLEADLDGSAVTIEYWHNQGDGTFEDLTDTALPQTGDASAVYLRAADLNGDGWIDLVASGNGCNGHPVPADSQIFLNDGDGTFTEHLDLVPDASTAVCSRLFPMHPTSGASAGLLRVRNGAASEVLIQIPP